MTEQPLIEFLSRTAWATYRKSRSFMKQRFGKASHPYTEISRTSSSTEIVIKFPWSTKSKDIKIILGPGFIEVHAKVKEWGSFYRKIELMEGVDTEKIKTTFHGGKLAIHIPTMVRPLKKINNHAA